MNPLAAYWFGIAAGITIGALLMKFQCHCAKDKQRTKANQTREPF